jgi:hypothetical protein
LIPSIFPILFQTLLFISFHFSPLLLYDVIGFGNVYISYDSLLNLSSGIGVKNHANYQVCNKMQTHCTPPVFKVRNKCGNFQMGLDELIMGVQSKINLHKPRKRPFRASWSQNDAWTNQTHKTHHGPKLEKIIASSFIVLFCD